MDDLVSPLLPGQLNESNLKTILVCGASGAGKSKFINSVTGANLSVGHGIDSETDRVIDEGIPLIKHGANYIQLVDTPGFQDTRDGDEIPVFKNITEWLAARYAGKLRAVGLIYLRSIQEARVLRPETRLIQMFKDLCGDDCLDRVVLVTNRWQLDSDNEEEDREKAIISDTRRFGSTGAKKVQIRRLQNKYKTEDAMEIVKLFATSPPITLQIQREIVDYGVPFNETTAGSHIEADLRKRIEEMDKNNEALRKNLEYAQRQIEELKNRPTWGDLFGRIIAGVATLGVTEVVRAFKS